MAAIVAGPTIAAASARVTAKKALTTKTLDDPVWLNAYSAQFGNAPGIDGDTPDTDASLGTWWAAQHGVRFDDVDQTTMLSASGKVVTLGAPDTWAKAAKAEGGKTSSTPTLGWLAVWAAGASIETLDPASYESIGESTAPADGGDVALVTGITSNDTMEVARPDPVSSGSFALTTVPAKEKGLTFVHFADSEMIGEFVVTIKNTTHDSIDVAATIDTIPVGSLTILPTASNTLEFEPFGADLRPNTIVVTRAGTTVATLKAANGSTKVLTLK